MSAAPSRRQELPLRWRDTTEISLALSLLRTSDEEAPTELVALSPVSDPLIPPHLLHHETAVLQWLWVQVLLARRSQQVVLMTHAQTTSIRAVLV